MEAEPSAIVDQVVSELADLAVVLEDPVVHSVDLVQELMVDLAHMLVESVDQAL